MGTTSISRRAAWIRLLTGVSLLAACANAARAQATGGNADTLRVTIRVLVVDSLDGSAVEVARVFAFSDTGAAPVAEGFTARDGIVDLRVPRDSITLRVQRIGYHRRQATIHAPSRARYAVAHEFRIARAVIRSGGQAVAPEWPVPTVDAPCRPYDENASRATRLLWLVTTLPASDMADLRFASVRHVVDRGRCVAAVAAIATHVGRADSRMQVHLFQLGYQGWAAHLATSSLPSIVYVLDWNLTTVRAGLSF